MSAIRRSDAALLAIVAVLGVSVASAQTAPRLPSSREIEFADEKVNALNLDVGVGATQSDNISRVSTNEESGTVAIGGLNLKIRQNTRRLQADVDADIGYEHFVDGESEDGVIGQARGVVTVGLVPESVEWFLEDQFSQSRVDVFSADTPENRQNVNRFETGPDAQLRLNDTLALRLSGRYSAADYETSAADGDRVSGSIALARQLGTAREASFNVSSEDVNFDDAANVGYQRNSAYLRYEAQSSRTELSADLGYNRIEDDLGVSAEGMLLDVLLLRRVSADSRLSLNLGTRFSDAGEVVLLAPGTERGGLDPLVVNGEPFEGRHVNLAWEFDRNRTSLGVFVEYRQERYEDSVDSDRDMLIFNAHVYRRLSSRIEMYARVENAREDFDNAGSYNEGLLGNLGFMVRLGNTARIGLEGVYRDRQSTNTVSEYTENRLSLYVVWSPLSRGQEAPPRWQWN